MTSPVKVKKSVRRYLDHQSGERNQLRRTLEHISTSLDDSIIFGGMIREFGLGNSRTFKSDIDIVSRSNSSEIYSAIKKYDPKINKFGGYRFLVGMQLFDIWSFENTWAFQKGLVDGALTSDIFKTTFFNLDAAAFNLKTKELFYSSDYIEALKTRTLDLNLKENPSPTGMARRAVKMVIENELSVSRRLGEYIIENIDRDNFSYTENSFLLSLKKFLSCSDRGTFNFTPQKSLF